MNLAIWTAGLSLTWSNPSHAFGEDHNGRSSVHYELVEAMAWCAGYTSADATLIAEASQATDNGSYGSVTFPASFTARTGASSETFHFPLSVELFDARRWANGSGPLLDSSGQLIQVDSTHACDATAPYTCSDGTDSVDGGSIEALGIALHMIGDHYSHLACMNQTGLRSHDTAYPVCDNPHHKREWGDGTYSTTSPIYNCTLDSSGNVATNTYTVYGNPVTVATCSYTPLASNALDGVKAIRDFLYSHATSVSGNTTRAAVSDADLLTFVEQYEATDRVAIATSIMASCP